MSLEAHQIRVTYRYDRLVSKDRPSNETRKIKSIGTVIDVNVATSDVHVVVETIGSHVKHPQLHISVWAG